MSSSSKGPPRLQTLRNEVGHCRRLAAVEDLKLGNAVAVQIGLDDADADAKLARDIAEGGGPDERKGIVETRRVAVRIDARQVEPVPRAEHDVILSARRGIESGAIGIDVRSWPAIERIAAQAAKQQI